MKLWPIAALAALAGGLLAFSPSAPTPTPIPTPTPAPAAADEGDVYAKLVKEHGDAVVTIKYNLKEEDEESEEEVQGVVIEESGLVLTSNLYMGGLPEALKQMWGKANSKPLEIKVLIGSDQEGVEAALVARDSELDLAWLQISNKDNKKFAFIDVSKPAEIKLGDRIMTLERLTKANDYAHFIRESRVRSLISKPRKLAVPGEQFDGSIGMAVFNEKGQYVGFSCIQVPSKEELESQKPSRFAQTRRIPSAKVLPGEDVVKATSAAKEQIKSGKPVDDEPKVDVPPPGVAKPGDAPEPKPEEPKKDK